MNELFFPFGNLFSLFRSKVKGAYNFGVDVIHASTQFNTFARDKEKLAIVLSNPAVLKVVSLQCDLFSMGKVLVCDDDGEEIEDDPFLDLLRKPNPFTLTEAQFLWDFMFWNMLGSSYCYVNSKVVDGTNNRMYFLDPSRIEWPAKLEKKKDKLIFSDTQVREIMKTNIIYRYQDGGSIEFPFDRLVISHDLTNSVGNFFKSPSRLDALYKIISNSEHVLDSENINIRYSGKFLVGSEWSTGTTSKLGMTDEEKKDIIDKIDSNQKNVYPVRGKLNLNRFVDDLGVLQLPQEYLHQYFLIGNMYNIPRDVLEAYNSATYENQEKARAAHVNYTLEPKGNQFMDGFEVHFGYKEQKRNIKISWEHLPFMQIFAKEKVETQKATIEVLNSLLTLGVSIEQANEYLGTKFEIEKPPQSEAPQDGQGQEIGQEQTEESGGSQEESASESDDSEEEIAA